MATKKDNPLIGSFRAPVPGAPPPAGPAEGKKPPEPLKDAPDPKATSTTPVKTDEGKKPTEPPKGTPDPKATGTTPAKADEGKKPAEPPKDTPDPKATGDTPVKGSEGKKPDAPPKDAPDPKAAGVAPAKGGEGKSQEQADLRFVKLADIKPLPGTYVKDTPRKHPLINRRKTGGKAEPFLKGF